MWLEKKKQDVAQNNIVYAILKFKKKCVGGVMRKKLKRGIRALRLKKMGGGAVYKLRYQTKQKYICRKIMLKKAISSFVFCQLYIIKRIC